VIIVPIFCFGLGQHTLEAGTVAVRAGAAIIHKEYRVQKVVLLGVFQKDSLLEKGFV
jgi:hypothetical protein